MVIIETLPAIAVNSRTQLSQEPTTERAAIDTS
jgi:hypothetical protein